MASLDWWTEESQQTSEEIYESFLQMHSDSTK